MSERICGINSVADARYYHFVVVKGGTSIAAYWKQLRGMGALERAKAHIAVESPRFTLEHRKLRLDKSYARGEVALHLSEEGRGRPPFLYDLFAFQVGFGKDTYLVFGFPFAALAVDVVSYLFDRGFWENAEFQGVDLGRMLSEDLRPLPAYEGLGSSVVQVQFVVTDDKSLTAVKLGGHDPFHAQIYELFLRKKFEERLWLPDQCVLACERQVERKEDGKPISVGLVTRSRLHIDKFGNYKFYMHSLCSNAVLMAYAIAQIRAAECLQKVHGNPLRRIEQEFAD
jgi:hypothetical protein